MSRAVLYHHHSGRHQATSSWWKWWMKILIYMLVVMQSSLILNIQADELSDGPQDLRHDPQMYSQQLSLPQESAQRQSGPKRDVPIPPISTNITRTSTSTKIPYPMQYFWTKEEYPNPLKEPFLCKQPRASLLCDPDRFLDQQEAEEIRKLLDKAKQSKKCFCPKCPAGEYGLKIGVALAGNIFSDTNDASQEFADELHRKWNFALCNDSILLLLIRSYPGPQQSSLTTSMGNVAEKVFPADFFRNVIPNHALSDENYGKFLQSILTAIIDHVESIDDTARFINLKDGTPMAKISNNDANNSANSTTSLLVLSIIAGFVVFIAFLVGAMILLKRQFQREPDPELPKSDAANNPYMKSPPGYESVNQNDEEDNNNNQRHDNENNESSASEHDSPPRADAHTGSNEDFNIGGETSNSAQPNEADDNDNNTQINNNNDSFHPKDTPV